MSSEPTSLPLRPSKTKIVATVGPACDSEDRLAELLAAGVDVFRLNMAHGGPKEQEVRLAVIRRVSQRLGQPVAVLADLAGPKIRLGELPGGQLACNAGQRVRFVREARGQGPGTRDEGRGTKTAMTQHAVPSSTAGLPSPLSPPPSPATPTSSLVPRPSPLTTTYEPLLDELAVGDRIMLADGTVSLVVEVVTREYADCRVVQPGVVRSRQGVNLPGVKLSAPALGTADQENARWAAASQVDFVGLSFVRRADDVRQLKSLLAAEGSDAQVIAKIEKPEALEQLDEIVAAADAIMVARGDLGVEIDVARVAVVQKEIVAACHRHRRPVIIATQMLDSMQHSRIPTRAEVADVSNAILDGADACMLSGETAVGEYPRETVEMMHRIALETEPICRGRPQPPGGEPVAGLNPITEATVYAAGRVADHLDAKLLVVASASGATALSVAKHRNFVPTVGVSDSPAVVRRMCLYWGVIPLAGAPTDDPTALLRFVTAWGRTAGLLVRGDRIVLVAGTGLAVTKHNMIVVHEME